MAAFVLFHDFKEALGKKIHDLNVDELRVYATNFTPNAATMTVKTELPEIGAGNGYPAGGTDTQNTYTETAGVGSCTPGVSQITLTASGGSFGPLLAVVLYNNTPGTKPLIGYWLYPGGSVTVNDGEPFRITFGTSLFTVT